MWEMGKASETTIPEVRKPEIAEDRSSCLEAGMTVREAGSFFKRIYDTFAEAAEDRKYTEEFLTSYTERINRTPKGQLDTGETYKSSWDGERGESTCRPTEETQESREVLDKLRSYGLEGIRYKHGEPHFTRCAVATVTIEEMSKHRPENFRKAAKEFAESWNIEGREGRTDWSYKDVENWRKSTNLTWHERCDMKTMDLVDTQMHMFFTHSGGVAECRIRDRKEMNSGNTANEYLGERIPVEGGL